MATSYPENFPAILDQPTPSNLPPPLKAIGQAFPAMTLNQQIQFHSTSEDVMEIMDPNWLEEEFEDSFLSKFASLILNEENAILAHLCLLVKDSERS